jgi:hypothetical protein
MAESGHAGHSRDAGIAPELDLFSGVARSGQRIVRPDGVRGVTRKPTPDRQQAWRRGLENLLANNLESPASLASRARHAIRLDDLLRA